VQVNFDYEGNSTVAGAFARNKAGRTFVVHSGRAGGGAKGITRKRLLDCMRTTSTAARASWGNRDCEVIVISELGSSKLRSEFAQFVIFIETCKKHIRNRRER
jgi:hypothetical protein